MPLFLLLLELCNIYYQYMVVGVGKWTTLSDCFRNSKLYS
jgi:hypothetical protein